MRGPEHPAVQLSPGPVEGGARAGAAVPRAAMNGRAGPWVRASDHGRIRVALAVSTPIAARPSNGEGIAALRRSATRRTMSPAVLHATCRKPLTVFRFATLISHVHSDSESRVNRLPGSAHGTIVTTAPHRGRSTRGMSATGSTSSSRNPDDANDDGRRHGRNRGASCRSGSIGACPRVDARGSRARVRNAAANP